MSWPILTVAIGDEADLVLLRQRARRIAELLGFDTHDQTRIGTALSEIARNALGYGGGGKAEFILEGRTGPQSLVVRVSDSGPGIADLDAAREGRHRSAAGLGLGIAGARRLMDRFELDAAPGGGTMVTLAKGLPRRQAPVTPRMLGDLVGRLAQETATDPLVEIREQNQELMRSLDLIQARQEELAKLNAELEDTNRGVVALYAELDDKAEQLKAASELKSRFLSNMSHEFRTPLNSILALSRLLLDRVDGPLAPEQERQVGYIRKSAESLTDLVNDLLDLAKVEAGKVDLHPVAFTVEELFGGLRGVLKPLQTSANVELVFEEPRDLPPVYTDEGKVSQILRNFISNALKFTDRGVVRVSAAHAPASDRLLLAVQDTGIGIAPEHHATIFEEFAQVENPLQGRSKGTGLGLPLSRRLAELLGGTVEVESVPGTGSTFRLSIPREIGRPAEAGTLAAGETSAPRPRALVIDDEEAFRYTLRQMIGAARYDVIEASDGIEGLERARAAHPDVIFLDLQMPRLDGYAVLSALAADAATRDIRVIVSTSAMLGAAERAGLLQAHAILPKAALSSDTVAALLRADAPQAAAS